MDYEKIASQVHQFVTDPQQFLSSKKETSLTDKEMGFLKNTKTQSVASGNVMAVDSTVLETWG
ncbi:hypothetical protein LPY66_16200 [Dehalobacter sp. DCM]|uniref:hypothetical protein n=1 Tax=Dehalobacter sp. DCM TaxID=2907827 RepID=UPI0030814D28|nr:hypothetical protein LPY66_16200 [Dehalobacter sp. DCM]